MCKCCDFSIDEHNELRVLLIRNINNLEKDIKANQDIIEKTKNDVGYKLETIKEICGNFEYLIERGLKELDICNSMLYKINN